MADLFDNLTVARSEWLSADANYKVQAIVVAECLDKFGSVSDARIEEYRTARDAERAAWNLYQQAAHAGEEVNALGTTGKLKLDVDKEVSA